MANKIAIFVMVVLIQLVIFSGKEIIVNIYIIKLFFSSNICTSFICQFLCCSLSFSLFICQFLVSYVQVWFFEYNFFLLGYTYSCEISPCYDCKINNSNSIFINNYILQNLRKNSISLDISVANTALIFLYVLQHFLLLLRVFSFANPDIYLTLFKLVVLMF
jgi:hypothetical protein